MRSRIFSISTDGRGPDYRTVIVTGFVALCIALNALVPRFSIRQREFDLLTDLLRTPSSLICFFSFSSIPLKIVGDLMKEGKASARTPKKPVPTGDDGTSSPSEFSFIALDTKAAVRYDIADGGGGKELSGVSLFLSSVERERLRAGPPGEPAVVILLILMFYFLFARSSLPGDAARFSSSKIFRNPTCFSGRVLLFTPTQNAPRLPPGDECVLKKRGGVALMKRASGSFRRSSTGACHGN